MFVVQDSWWGRGGVAYEYFKDTGMLQKLDYVSNANPTPEPLDILSGKVDDIGIDGDGYLYVLRTEKEPTDDVMSTCVIETPALSTWKGGFGSNIDITTLVALPPYLDTVTSTGWKRRVVTMVNGDPITEIVDVNPGEQQPEDFIVVKIKQKIYKTVKRYPQGTGSLGKEEFRGKVKAGLDEWTREAVLQSDGGIQWRSATWSVEADGSKDSNIPGELAVVNLAKIPANFEGTVEHHIVALNGAVPDNAFSSAGDNPSINEHDVMTFKIEGYKPYIDGKFQTFKPMGDIVDPVTGNKLFANVQLNSIPNANGDYRHDENGDGAFSGFPSNMFEATGRKTTVTWTVDFVEGNTVAEAESKIIQNLVPGQDGAGELATFTYKFPHPGNYLVRAAINYNYFTFPNTADSRPHQLIGNTTPTPVKTTSFLVKVVAKSLNLNQSPGFISNITMKPVGNLCMPGVTSSGKTGSSKIDFIEDTNFSGIEIGFDAQFVRDANFVTNVGGDLETYDGIGVWDYSYYAQMYKDIANVFPSLPYSAPALIETIGSTDPGDHVYNYNPTGVSSDIKTMINLDAYNPGRMKGSDVKCNNGTRLDQDPIDKDWAFIQWGLYLRPNSPYKVATATSALGSDVRHERGILVASGSCSTKNVTGSIGDRKFSVGITVPATAIKTIMTPKDPETYSLNLEIIYPRVSWVANDLGDNKNEKRFSSMIPLFSDVDSLSTNDKAGNNPMHVLGRMHLSNDGSEPSGNYILNQSWKFGGNEFFNAGGDATEVRARDVTLPTLVQTPGENPTPIIQTTGDDVTDVTVGFASYDNNPFAEFKDFFAAYQTLKNASNVLDNSEANKQFKAESKISGAAIKRIAGADEPDYFQNDKWINGASFTTTILEYGPAGPFQKDKPYENWIGSLNYTVMGSVYDGIGSDAKDITHQFYHEKACTDLGMSINDDEKILVDNNLVKAVERFDNDPPSLEVELVSQVDNRRWVFKLDENIHDDGPVPTTVNALGKCKMSVKCYNLQGNTEVANFSNEAVDGCAGYPNQIGENRIVVTDLFADAVPKFRRASRLLLNVHIFDNTGFRALEEATLIVEDNDGSTTRSLLPANSPGIPTIPSLNVTAAIINSLDTRPRASYAIDMPMKINGEKQVKIELKARDGDNNERILTIPVTVVESTFETRVLETKENKN